MTVIRINRTAVPLFNTRPTYANRSITEIGNNSADVMGAPLPFRSSIL